MIKSCPWRQIPAQAWFMQPLFTLRPWYWPGPVTSLVSELVSTLKLLRCAIGGILPFGAVFTELFFIMRQDSMSNMSAQIFRLHRRCEKKMYK